MSPQIRKLALTTHVVASVGWVGALAVFLTHAIGSVAAKDPFIVRAACVAMGVTAGFVIFPLSLLSVGSGIVQALGTTWGLLRHYWVVAKLLLTVIATAVLLLKLPVISGVADAATATTFSPTDLLDARISLLAHAVGGLAILLAVATLAVYKPPGLTSRAGMPRWVKVFAIVLIVIVLALVAMMHGGRHGPGAHAAVSSGTVTIAVPQIH